MLYIQHYIKTIHFWLKYNGLAIVRKTTKLIEGGHRDLQDYRHICYYFYVFLRFFKIQKVATFYVFLPCFVRFLELWSPTILETNTIKFTYIFIRSFICTAVLLKKSCTDWDEICRLRSYWAYSEEIKFSAPTPLWKNQSTCTSNVRK